jgi:hypothetical protein
MIIYRTAEINIDTGMVTAIAITICFPISHFTFFGFSAAPTPMTDIVMTWVEETGAPMIVEIASDEAEKKL